MPTLTPPPALPTASPLTTMPDEAGMSRADRRRDDFPGLTSQVCQNRGRGVYYEPWPLFYLFINPGNVLAKNSDSN